MGLDGVVVIACMALALLGWAFVLWRTRNGLARRLGKRRAGKLIAPRLDIVLFAVMGMQCAFLALLGYAIVRQ